MNDTEEQKAQDELMAKAAALPKSLAPKRDLWPGIEQAITSPARPQRSAWQTVWAQAAAIVLLVGGSSGLTYLAMSGNDDPATVVGAGTTLVFQPVSGSFGSQYNLGPDYLDARRDLVARLDSELNRLPPETRTEVLANMQLIHQAIEDINKALAEDPDNVLLQEMLLQTYRNELSLMMKVDDVARAAMRRGDI